MSGTEKQNTDFNPPPQYAAPPYIPPPPGATIITSAPAAVVTANIASGASVLITAPVGPQPTRIVCRSCQAEIVTRIESKASLRTHLMAALLCGLGCWCCVCIPYCKDSCMNADHYCPNCNAYIGTYQP